MAAVMHARSLDLSRQTFRDERVAICGATIAKGEPSCWWTELGTFSTPPAPPCADCLRAIVASGWTRP